ncbi:MAG: hypothetical protein ABIJ96_18335 [Elusimicrobiota bacterium]
MTSLRQKYKPRASRLTRLMVASLVWSCVGCGLFAAGAGWLVEAGGTQAALLLAAGLIIGAVKGRFVLAPRAATNGQRIIDSGDDRCLGSVFSWRTWGLVVFFMCLGKVLRASPLPRPFLGALYVGIGSALAGASLVTWKLWWRCRREGALSR